jgi:hypothetical protein
LVPSFTAQPQAPASKKAGVCGWAVNERPENSRGMTIRFSDENQSRPRHIQAEFHRFFISQKSDNTKNYVPVRR